MSMANIMSGPRRNINNCSSGQMLWAGDRLGAGLENGRCCISGGQT